MDTNIDNYIRHRLYKFDQDKVNALDRIGYVIIAVLIENGYDDAYIEDKIETLSKHYNQGFSALYFAVNQLTGDNLNRFAERSNVSVAELQIANKVFVNCSN